MNGALRLSFPSVLVRVSPLSLGAMSLGQAWGQVTSDGPAAGQQTRGISHSLPCSQFSNNSGSSVQGTIIRQTERVYPLKASVWLVPGQLLGNGGNFIDTVNNYQDG
ncbi:hypothetical protein C8Q76DRAFT_350980 [Earliella scabrosa]|nr:hypothetical protein C8Q76DRAFT_350980 [Earliella scabrosa]